MKTLLIALSVITFSISAMAQNDLKVGSKLKIEVITYPTSFELNPVFLTGKMKDKEKAAVSVKEDIASGKIKPKTTAIVLYNVIEVKDLGGKKVVTMKMVDANGGDYKSMVEFGKDSVYIHHCIGATPIVDKGETKGMMYNGTQVIANNLTEGSRTQGYSDIMMMVPQDQLGAVKMQFSEGGGGNYSYTGHVTQKFKATATTSMLTLNQSGTVMQKDKVSINGKDVDTYMIGTEVWSKFGTQIDFQLEQQDYFADPILNDKILKRNQKYFDKGAKKSQAKINEITGANEHGYVVKYKEEWFTPAYGIVKSINYDNWGLPVTTTRLISVE